MKEYFMTCREAINQKLLRLLDEKQHFVENSYMYSLQDLIDTNNGTLLKFLTDVHDVFLKHIKEECQVMNKLRILSSTVLFFFNFDFFLDMSWERIHL